MGRQSAGIGKQSAVIDQRATPADPLPGVSVDRTIPGPKRTMPPELGPDAIAVLEGRTFMYSDSVGDVPKGSIGGLVHADTRFLSRWVLTINGAPLLVLRSGTVDHYSAEFFLTNPRLDDLPANSVGLRRLRFVGDGLHERIELESFLHEPLKIELRLAVGNDFADLFEIKDRVRDRSEQIVRTPAADRSGLTFSYTNQTFTAETTVEVVGRGDEDRRRRPASGGSSCRRAGRGPASSTCRSSSARASSSRCIGLRRRLRRRDGRPGQRAGSPSCPGSRPTRTCSARSSTRRPATCSRCGSRPAYEDQAVILPAAGPALVPHRLRPRHADHRLPDGRLRTAAGPGRAARAGLRCRARTSTTSGTRSRARSCTRSGRAS